MTKKWQKVAASKRKRNSLPKAQGWLIQKVAAHHQDEFGLPSGGPITLPCDAIFMEYAISLIQRHATKDVEKALLMSLATGRCLPSSHLHQEQSNQLSLICSF
ncbi:hypothetical protein Patl1_35815 [Pistacia atlantica]|nr:hypothetical protein Patl1_35815 [Pistacia atlantica]